VAGWGTLGRAAGEAQLARRVRIVVGEGRTAQRGLLRFVLEGEGFDVVGEASGSADLSGVIEDKKPDVVVLDDGIGVMAVSMVHDVAPDTKIVLVWPSAVVPIGGDARVEPAKILKDLGPAVEHVAAATVGITETFQRPEWIDRVRKDPATLREKLLGSKETTTRPSVTRLQRRGRRLHPTGRRSRTVGEERREEDIPVPLVVLPGGDGGTELEPVLDIGGAGTAGTGLGDEPVEERSEWNRRLGTLALSGAAAVSALVLALALGGGRIPISGVRGGGTLPPGASAFDRPGSSIDGPFGPGSLGGSGYTPIPVPVPEPPVGTEGGSGGPIGSVDGGLGGDLASPGTSGGSDGPATGEAPGDGGTGGGGGNDGGGGTGGGGTGGGGENGGGGGNGGTGGNGGAKAKDGMPGKSAEHNPHGGPPSRMGQTPAHGQGNGVADFAPAEQTHVHKH
jgi:hypothetical protein